MSYAASKPEQQSTLFGHPTGLYMLFFAEMWERFSYYGMRALLVLYMIKGFLQFGDDNAYAVYGAYTALVYATPFIGGMLADRLLGPRRAVVFGGLLMAAGHLLMTLEYKWAFFGALALLICGNGFFKPNISTIVGSIYPRGSTKRDAGFTIFYMGINLGATMSPLLCGYVGETFGWHYGFGLATVGMLVGLAVFVAPGYVCQALILVGALLTAIGMVYIQDNAILLAINAFVAAILVAAGIVAFVALGRGGLPEDAGAPNNPKRLHEPAFAALPWLSAQNAVYLGVLLAIPAIALLVQYHEMAAWLLIVFGGLAFLSLVYEAIRSVKVERERLFVVLILMFFSMLFWSFFEQAGSSLNNFTDRNVDRVFEPRHVTEADVGKTIKLTLTQEQLGYSFRGEPFTLNKLDEARKKDEGGTNGENSAAPTKEVVDWPVTSEHVGMGIAEKSDEVPASTFQAVNPIFIILFALPISFLWTFLAARNLEPSTPFKFALGLLQLGLGFGAYWYGTTLADDRGMVHMSWLIFGYLLQTTGELCLSPVGLSMVTKLSPSRIVSTVMGAWFLATAFSNYLAGAIARLTGVTDSEGGEKVIPVPSETVHVYGDVFGKIAIAAIISAAICFVLVPLLKRWMHEELDKQTLEPADGSSGEYNPPRSAH
jgi:proton-dependent oligopeptide transporter, POT family